MKILLMVIGSISLGLGMIGVVLPVLPTTPFLLISLACYMRSSRKLYDFVLSNKYLGPYVKDYVDGKGIPIKAKKRAIFLIWITIGFSVLFVIDKIFLRLMLLTIASIVSIYIWTRSTPESKNIADINQQ
ncbi:YbaN family protein [Geosporobacter ferrireducens]|nr:YbaN family protein [Geosporobacter ferrireducens]